MLIIFSACSKSSCLLELAKTNPIKSIGKPISFFDKSIKKRKLPKISKIEKINLKKIIPTLNKFKGLRFRNEIVINGKKLK